MLLRIYTDNCLEVYMSMLLVLLFLYRIPFYTAMNEITIYHNYI